MYEFSIAMALVDFIPVALFGVSAVLLLQDLYEKMGKGSYAVFAAGMVNVFIAGFLKAVWKLLYAAGICDFQVFNTMFLPVQSIGFLLLGIGLVEMLCKKKQTVLLAAPPVFGGSMVFIACMVAGLGCLCTCLSIVAAKMKRKGVIILMVLAFIAYMGMGYMSSQDSTSAVINWIEQGINCLGQALLLGGVWILHRAGLKAFKI